MVLKMTGDVMSESEAGLLGKPENNTGGPARQGGGAKKSPGVRRVEKTDYAIAQDVVGQFSRPLTFQNGEFWGFTEKEGWSNCSQELFCLAAKLKKKNPDKCIMPIIENQVRVPKDHVIESLYWERTGDAWNPKWVPLTIKQTELLFAEQIYDVLTGESVWLNGRIIYGPMISLNYSYAEGDETEVRCPEFESLVAHAIPDQATRDHFQECCATILQPHATLRGQIVMWGKPYSGKTTLATAIGCCPGGRRGLSQAQEEELVRDKYTPSALVNRFANVSDDSASSRKWVSFLKRYTSGSMLVEAKYHMPETVTPPAKLISTCNQVQSLVDPSGAGVDRMLAFKFEHALPKIHGTSNDSKMTVLYWSQPERRNGILTWLVEGLVRLRLRGRFDPPASWVASLEEAAGKADPIAETLTELLVACPDGFVSVAEVAALFDGPDHATGNKSLVNKLPDYMERLFGAKKDKKYVEGKQVRGYKGVMILQEAKDNNPG